MRASTINVFRCPLGLCVLSILPILFTGSWLAQKITM